MHPIKTSMEADDTIVILEVGASTNWNFRGGANTFALNLASKYTPIENWLELEAVIMVLREELEGMGHRFSFKRPWDTSEKAEFVLGVSPQWAHL